MVDLSASSAPSTEAALRHVSHELTRRFEIRVNVSVLREGSGGSLEPAPLAREQLVRIAREAIVNAVKHGGAANVDVELDLRGRRLSLRISDDGCGMEQARVSVCEQPGFGLPSMRARAESLGGRLLTRRGAQGGTEIELLIR
jgi:signal transduction histidine kinase